jgi:L-rhamnose mutarotase
MPRKKSNIHYIYKTTCKITGRYYIGMHSTNNFEDGYLGSGKILRYSIRKYGEENHIKEVIEYQPNRELLIEREKDIITNDMIVDSNCMNIMSGGTGGFISVEQQRYRSICGGTAFAKKLNTDDEFRKKHNKRSSETMKKYHKSGVHNYNTFEGKKHSDETKELISKKNSGKHIGEMNSQYGTCWIVKENINKKIKKVELDTYLKEGWINGRIM